MGLAAGAPLGCGDDDQGVPANAVATVGDEAITRVAFKSQLASYAEGNRPLRYDPPDFTRCASARKDTQPAPEGEEQPGLDRFRDDCRREFEQLRVKAMGALLEQAWVEQEADRRGVNVPDRKVRRVFDSLRRNAFPDSAKYQQYLKRARLRESTLLAQVRWGLEDQALDDDVKREVRPRSEREIAAYYAKHRAKYRTPARRDLHAVIADTKASAMEAKRALARGESWPSVVGQYSLDKASVKTGGEVRGYVGGAPFSGDLDSVVARARKGVLTGPVKTQFTWWVFEVDKVFPAKQQALADVRQQIEQELVEKDTQRRLTDYAKEFRLRYRAQTLCADGYEVAECKNGPKENPVPPASMTADDGQ
jgi:foldase protein PrsA